jgi:hypothetical protein
MLAYADQQARLAADEAQLRSPMQDQPGSREQLTHHQGQPQPNNSRKPTVRQRREYRRPAATASGTRTEAPALECFPVPGPPSSTAAAPPPATRALPISLPNDAACCHLSRPCSCSTGPMGDVQRPGWWSYPLKWSHEHRWGPGRVIVSWTPCLCAGGDGHLRVHCAEPECPSVWCQPPHIPALS